MNHPIQNKVDSVFVHVSDLKQSAQWYSMIMGLPVKEERLDGGPVYWFDMQGETGLILDNNQENRKRENWNEELAPLFMYSANDIAAAYQFTQRKGAEITLELETPHPGLSFFNFSDPEGNVFMVCRSDYDAPPIETKTTDSPIHNRIGATFINVKDMNNAIEWHSNILGLPVKSGNGSGGIYELETEDGAEILIDNNRFLEGDEYSILFMFDTDDIDEAYQFAQGNYIEIFTEVERHGSISFFTCKDPDGNVLMVCQSDE